MAQKRKMSVDGGITPSLARWSLALPFERLKFEATSAHRRLKPAQVFRCDFLEEATTKQQRPAPSVSFFVSYPPVRTAVEITPNPSSKRDVLRGCKLLGKELFLSDICFQSSIKRLGLRFVVTPKGLRASIDIYTDPPSWPVFPLKDASILAVFACHYRCSFLVCRLFVFRHFREATRI
jgi:hypothetical protein